MRKIKQKPEDTIGHGSCIMQLLIVIMLMVCIIFKVIVMLKQLHYLCIFDRNIIIILC